LARYSALEQVVKLNLRELGAPTQRRAANIQRDGTPEEYANYEWAVRTFLDRLPAATGITPDRIVIAIDGLREAIYEPSQAVALMDSVWGRMRRFMAVEAVRVASR